MSDSPAPKLAPPILYEWQGDGWKPIGRFGKEADRHFAIGERRVLVEHDTRSQKSHAHQFAAINEAWANLPEDVAMRFPTSETLRKYALCRAGYCNIRQIALPSRAAATEVLRAIGSDYDYASVEGNVVTLYTAQSQSYARMGRKVFYESKARVLEVIADLLGVAPETLAHEAEREAA